MDPLPDYLEETVAGAMDLLANVLLPQVLGQSFANPESLARDLAPWRANHMAKATVEMADCWIVCMVVLLNEFLSLKVRLAKFQEFRRTAGAEGRSGKRFLGGGLDVDSRAKNLQHGAGSVRFHVRWANSAPKPEALSRKF